MRRTTILYLTMALAWPAWAGGDASDGHTHAPPVPVVLKAAAPRAAAVSEEFEAVAVLEDGKLVLYLDSFASNAPVGGAKIEVGGEGLRGVAAESAPGVYTLDARAFPASGGKAGRYPLTLAVETAASADLLTATLEIAPAAAAAHAHGWSEWASWLGAGVIALAGAALVAIRRRKQHKGQRGAGR